MAKKTKAKRKYVYRHKAVKGPELIIPPGLATAMGKEAGPAEVPYRSDVPRPEPRRDSQSITLRTNHGTVIHIAVN